MACIINPCMPQDCWKRNRPCRLCSDPSSCADQYRSPPRGCYTGTVVSKCLPPLTQPWKSLQRYRLKCLNEESQGLHSLVNIVIDRIVDQSRSVTRSVRHLSSVLSCLVMRDVGGLRLNIPAWAWRGFRQPRHQVNTEYSYKNLIRSESCAFSTFVFQ